MLAVKYDIVPLATLVTITKVSYILFPFSQFQRKYREVPKISKNVFLSKVFILFNIRAENVVSSFQISSFPIRL